MKSEKKRLIIYVFGNSDLYVNGNFINNRKRNFLEETKKISQNLSVYEIDFPIFNDFLRKLKKEYGEDERYKLIGVFTEQDSVFRNDTIYLKEIFKNYLADFSNVNFSEANCIILPEWANVSPIYNYTKFFLEERSRFFNSFDDVNVAITSWTKGIVLAVFQVCLMFFDISKLSFFRVDEETKNCVEFRVAKEDIINEQIKKDLKLMAQHFDFNAIYNYTEFKNNYKKINKLANYCCALLNFDKLTANDINSDMEEYFGIKLPFYFKDDIRSILENALTWLWYTYITKKWVEFLGRIYNFSDILLSWIIKDKLEFKLEKGDEYYSLGDIISNDKFIGLREYLNNKKQNWISLVWDIKNNTHKFSLSNVKAKYLSFPLKKSIVSYFVEKEERNDMTIFLDFIIKLEKLVKYRNSTVIAHGTNLVSEEKIKSNYKGNIERV